MDSEQVSILLRRTFPWLISVGLVTAIFGTAVRVFLKRRHGEIVSRPPVGTARFGETWISGSGGGFASARNCMWVAVTDDAVIVGLHFPFSVFVPRWLGLEARIAPENLLAIENRKTFFGGSQLAIRFRNDEGRVRSIELNLRREDAFVGQVRELCRAHGKAI